MVYLNGTAKGYFEDKIFLDGAEQCDVKLNGVSGTTRRGTLIYDDPFSNNDRHIEQYGIRGHVWCDNNFNFSNPDAGGGTITIYKCISNKPRWFRVYLSVYGNYNGYKYAYTSARLGFHDMAALRSTLGFRSHNSRILYRGLAGYNRNSTSLGSLYGIVEYYSNGQVINNNTAIVEIRYNRYPEPTNYVGEIYMNVDFECVA